MKSIKIIIYSVILLIATAYAQSAIERAINSIRTNIENENWESALSSIDRFRIDFPRSEYESTITYLAAQSALRARWLGRARYEAQTLLIKFPQSKYNDAARWVLAECSIQAEQWDEAKNHLDWLIGFALDDSVKTAARTRSDELRRLFQYREKLSKNKSNKGQTSTSPIAILLPFTGANNLAANAFKSGFEYYWHKNNLPKLLWLDTQGDPVKASVLIRKSIQDENIWAITGGIDIGEVAAIAASAELNHIPYVCTVSGNEHLTEIGKYVFQGRPDWQRIGTTLASRAINDFDLARFSIIAPHNLQGRQIAEAFKNEITDAGGEIIVEEYYYPGTQDLRKIFNQVRKIGLRRAFDDSLRLMYQTSGEIILEESRFTPDQEHLIPVLPPTDSDYEEEPTQTLSPKLLDSLWASEHQRIRQWMESNAQTIDSLEIPINVFDGFLLLIESGSIEIVAPQFARANIHTQLFGGENWGNNDNLSKVKSYIDGIVFAAPLYPDPSVEYDDFTTQLPVPEIQNGRYYQLAGERAARMLYFALTRSEGAETMRIALSQTRDLPTLSGLVSLLKEERVDRRVTLLQFKNGVFNKID